jgi:hypothetical protein
MPNSPVKPDDSDAASIASTASGVYSRQVKSPNQHSKRPYSMELPRVVSLSWEYGNIAPRMALTRSDTSWHGSVDDIDLAAGDPVSVPNLTPSVGIDVEEQLYQFGPTVVAASRLATSSVAAFKTLPENAWDDQDPRRRLGVVNFTPKDMQTDGDSKLEQSVTFIPEFNQWQFAHSYISRPPSVSSLAPRPPSPSFKPTTPSSLNPSKSILQRTPSPLPKGHIRIEIPKPATPSPDSWAGDEADEPEVAPSVMMRKHFAIPDELRSTKSIDKTDKFEDAGKLAAYGTIGLRSEQSHLFPLVRDRFSDPRTRWITIGYLWQAFEFISTVGLCIASMVLTSQSGVVLWLDDEIPAGNQDIYDARFSSLVSYKSLIVYQGLSIWAQLFQLAFFVDAIVNNNAVELAVMYMFVLSSLVSSAVRFVRDQEAWVWISRDPYNPDPNATDPYENYTYILNLTKLVIAAVSVVVWTPVLAKLYRLVGWRIYEWTGADVIVRSMFFFNLANPWTDRVRAHQIYVILLRLFLFIAVCYSVMWVVFVLDALYLSGNEIYGPSLALYLLLSLFFSCCGWLAARFQSLIVLSFYFVGIIVSLCIVPISLVHMQSMVPVGSSWSNPFDGVGITAGVLWIISFVTLFSIIINAYYFWNGPILSWHVLERVDDKPPTEAWWQLPPPVKRFFGRWTGFRWQEPNNDVAMEEVPRMSIDADVARMSIDADEVDSKSHRTSIAKDSAKDFARMSVDESMNTGRMDRAPSRTSRRPVSVLSVKISQRREQHRWAIDE